MAAEEKRRPTQAELTEAAGDHPAYVQEMYEWALMNQRGLDALNIKSDADLPRALHGDPKRLRQVLVNLVGNAIKFTERGSVHVRASLGPPDADALVVRFAVRDTGIGIPADKIGLLFGKFNQVSGSITRKYGGTGLGLTISRQLAGLMGGVHAMYVGFLTVSGTFELTVPLFVVLMSVLGGSRHWEHRSGVDLAGALGGGVLVGLARGVVLVLGRVEVGVGDRETADVIAIGTAVPVGLVVDAPEEQRLVTDGELVEAVQCGAHHHVAFDEVTHAAHVGDGGVVAHGPSLITHVLEGGEGLVQEGLLLGNLALVCHIHLFTTPQRGLAILPTRPREPSGADP